LLQQVLGRTREAEQAYKALLDSASGSSPPRLLDSYAMFLAAQDRTDEARRVMELQVQRNPDNQIALQRLQAVGRGLREPLVADAQGGAAEALLTTASLLTREDLGEVVEFYLQLALYLRPKFDAVLFLLGDLRENRKNWDGAVEAYRAIAPDSPYFQSARVREAWALNGKGEVEPAIGVLTRLTQQFPDSNEPAIALADMLRGKERFAEAVREYDRVIGRATPVQQRHWALFYSRGIAHERSKQWGKAEADFLKALELQPEQPLVLNYLGYSWIDRGENLHRARTMVERAVELRPNDGFIIDSLGWALYRLGDYQGAVVKLERAVELQPDDPVINDHLGDAYWRVGRQVEARFQWQRSLGLKPEAEAKAATERKLAVGLPPAAPQGSRAASNG
jgi:Flp pilus assembly protein TadD